MVFSFFLLCVYIYPYKSERNSIINQQLSNHARVVESLLPHWRITNNEKLQHWPFIINIKFCVNERKAHTQQSSVLHYHITRETKSTLVIIIRCCNDRYEMHWNCVCFSGSVQCVCVMLYDLFVIKRRLRLNSPCSDSPSNNSRKLNERAYRYWHPY